MSRALWLRSIYQTAATLHDPSFIDLIFFFSSFVPCCLLNSFALSLSLPTFSSLHAALLSRQHFNKQSPGNKMLVNGCILLAGSEGACQLLPLGCCSMWKQWRKSAFDASPTWYCPLRSSVFSLMEFSEVFFSNRRRMYQHPHRRGKETNTHGEQF